MILINFLYCIYKLYFLYCILYTYIYISFEDLARGLILIFYQLVLFYIFSY